MAISKEFVQSVRKSIGEKPGGDIGQLARSLNARDADVITALPVGMRLKARITSFEAIWCRMTRWGDLGQVLMGKRRLPLPLKRGACLKLLMQDKLKASDSNGIFSFAAMREALGYIWFIEQPEASGRGRSVSFLDKNGDHLLSVILNETESGEPSPAQLADFNDMKKTFGVVPIPKNRCAGCKGCESKAAGCSC